MQARTLDIATTCGGDLRLLGSQVTSENEGKLPFFQIFSGGIITLPQHYGGETGET